MLANGDSNIVDTIHEILEVFENYPQGADLAQLLAGKVDKVVGYGLSKNDLTDILKGRYDTAYNHSQVKDGSNPHKVKFDNLLDKPNSIGGYGILDGVTLSELDIRIGVIPQNRVRIFNNKNELAFTQMLYNGEKVDKIVGDNHLIIKGTYDTFDMDSLVYSDLDLVLGAPKRYVQTTSADFDERGNYTGTESYIILPARQAKWL